MIPAILLLLLFGPLPQSAQAQAKGNTDSPIAQEFAKRVAGYVDLHNSVKSEIHKLKPTKSAEAINIHEHKFSRALRHARRGVRQGNIFSVDIATEFRRLIATAMQGAGATRISKSLKHAEPVHLPALRVNSIYPEGVPLQSTPPSLLLNLPKLPSELEYRLVGTNLVLRDVEANLIVDLMPNAIQTQP